MELVSLFVSQPVNVAVSSGRLAGVAQVADVLITFHVQYK